jgi:Flp pilus assembly protein TadG
VLRDRGSTSLTTALLTPVFLVIAMMAFQAALWSHARTEARAVARDSAALVARSHANADDVARAALEVLRTGTDLAEPVVDISISDGVVTARIVGRAPGILRGTSRTVEVVEVLPIEVLR